MGLIVNEILMKTTHVNCSNIECDTLSNLLHTCRRKVFLKARVLVFIIAAMYFSILT